MSERVEPRFDTVNIILLALLFLFAWHPFSILSPSPSAQIVQ